MNVNVIDSAVQPVKTGSLRSRVYESLREAIFSGRLQPGDPIREVHMAKALQVSQPTVREALMQLQHEGLVVRNPHRDTVVTRLTADDIRERTRLRVLLESEAAIEALPHLGEAEWKELDAKLDGIHAALDADSYEAYVTADLAFHRYIWELSRNRTLYQTLDLITVPLFAFLAIRRSRILKDLVHSVHSHDPITAALRVKDPALIRQAFQDHLEGSYLPFANESKVQL